MIGVYVCRHEIHSSFSTRVCQVYPKDTRMQCPKMSLAVANEAEAAKCFRSTVSHVHSSDDIEDECRATQCASDANDVICTLIDRGEQWNVEKRVAALSQTEALCMQSKPVPEELRRAMVIGCDLNRKWLTVFSQSNFVIAAYEGAACHEDDGDKDSDEENSKEKKRKAMDRIVSKIMPSITCVSLLYSAKYSRSTIFLDMPAMLKILRIRICSYDFLPDLKTLKE